MEIRLWGVRGSLPTPMDRDEYRSKLIRALEQARELWRADRNAHIETTLRQLTPEYCGVIGGDTTCAEVRVGDSILILDMGTGAIRLGERLEQEGFTGELHVLLTHTHWDHIQGWPFFKPAYNGRNRIHFYSCLPDLRERFERQQRPEHFPLSFEQMPAQTSFEAFESGASFLIGPFQITTKPLIHPGGSVAYKIEAGGRSFIFATDTEFYGPDLHAQMDDYYAFFNHADLLVMDAQYSLEEAEQKRGWGHTAMTIAVDCSLHWQVRELALTHHEPAHSDQTIWELFGEAHEYLAEFATGATELRIQMAREGDVYRLEPRPV